MSRAVAMPLTGTILLPNVCIFGSSGLNVGSAYSEIAFSLCFADRRPPLTHSFETCPVVLFMRLGALYRVALLSQPERTNRR